MDKIKNITVGIWVNATMEKVWEYWTQPAHIINWNTASVDWHTLRAENNLTEGGRFVYRMEAKDGSFGFDFSGSYEAVTEQKQIAYILDDGRKVQVDFKTDQGKVSLTETFEPEDQNPIEMQRGGWQAILDNFKKYTEEN